MGLLQICLDAWVATMSFAVGRRMGVLAPPQLSKIDNETFRTALQRYLDAGEWSVDRLWHLQRSSEAFRGRGSDLWQRYGGSINASHVISQVQSSKIMQQMQQFNTSRIMQQVNQLNASKFAQQAKSLLQRRIRRG
mmetsp:Transcript_8155/g.18212  ORF Transcript_8155/g.18212 Transcript_8155/m.18212 type:complete len:136 (+) Transcript_8155:87-494(+)